MTKDYLEGFVKTCRARGVDPALVVKSAQSNFDAGGGMFDRNGKPTRVGAEYKVPVAPKKPVELPAAPMAGPIPVPAATNATPVRTNQLPRYATPAIPILPNKR